MTNRAAWTPYRAGIAVALLGFTSGAIFLIGFFNVVVNGFRPPFWPLVALLVVGTITAGLMNPYRGIRIDALNCPGCGKPAFRLSDSDDWETGMRTGLFWPERECSNCGRDLTQAEAT